MQRYEALIIILLSNCHVNIEYLDVDWKTGVVLHHSKKTYHSKFKLIKVIKWPLKF